MMSVDERMRRAGGPGILAFEFAGNGTRAYGMMQAWGAAGRRAARLSLWLDFGYMLTYGALLALLLERARLIRGHSAAAPAVAAVAVSLDAVEGVSLLRVLDGTDGSVNARRATVAASLKFAVLGGALAYVAVRRRKSDD